MATLTPFVGIRYSSSIDLLDVVCPPYDVISPGEQQRLHERHPNNAVRLELAQGAGGQKYRNAAATFEQWLASGVLVVDDAPALYVYRQDFTGPDGDRRHVAGVMGALELEEFGDAVLPHERTMPGPIEDRLALLRACPVNVSPIYSIYRGKAALAPYFGSLAERSATVQFVDDNDTLHRLWAVTSADEIDALSEAVARGPLVIADGHHRYETALAYRAEQRAPGANAIMCFCVDADSEDVVVLPYHRALRAHDTNSLQRGLGNMGAVAMDLEEALASLPKSGADHPFVFVLQDTTLFAEVSDADVVAAVGDRSPAWRGLDVVALHEAVLPELFPEGVEDVTFARDAHEIVRLVVDEDWTAGVLLRPVLPAQVVDVARSGERMPQKASYFWPKAVTGLVFRSLR
ncbi:MAG: DUF1015 family protein [Actinomycetota bacterium]